METKRYEQLQEIQQSLIDHAFQALEKAYNPYSHFAVGATIYTDQKNLYSGANVENASYGASLCAERVVLSNAFSNGDRTIRQLAIVGKGERLSPDQVTPPCGICRQVYYEAAHIAQQDIEILLASPDRSKVIRTSIQELFPLGYGPG